MSIGFFTFCISYFMFCVLKCMERLFAIYNGFTVKRWFQMPSWWPQYMLRTPATLEPIGAFLEHLEHQNPTTLSDYR